MTNLLGYNLYYKIFDKLSENLLDLPDAEKNDDNEEYKKVEIINKFKEETKPEVLFEKKSAQNLDRVIKELFKKTATENEKNAIVKKFNIPSENNNNNTLLMKLISEEKNDLPILNLISNLLTTPISEEKNKQGEEKKDEKGELEIEQEKSENQQKEQENNTNKTPRQESIETLIEISTKQGITSKNKFEQTPLYLACKKENSEIVNLIIDKIHKVDETETGEKRLLKEQIDAADINGKTPLIIASQMGKPRIVKLLIQKDANINAVDKNGRNALFIAAMNGNLTTVELLIEKGADINAIDNKGRNALFIAAKKGNLKVFDEILEKIDVSKEEFKKTAAQTIYYLIKNNKKSKSKGRIKNLLEKLNQQIDISDVELELAKKLLIKAIIKDNKDLQNIIIKKFPNLINERFGENIINLIDNNRIDQAKKLLYFAKEKIDLANFYNIINSIILYYETPINILKGYDKEYQLYIISILQNFKIEQELIKIINAVKDYEKQLYKDSSNHQDPNGELKEIVEVVEAVEESTKDSSNHQDPNGELKEIVEVVEAVENFITTNSSKQTEPNGELEKISKVVEAVENFIKNSSNKKKLKDELKAVDSLITIEQAIKDIIPNSNLELLKKYLNQPSTDINYIYKDITILGYACLFLNVDAVKIIKNNKNLDINKGRPNPQTILNNYMIDKNFENKAKVIEILQIFGFEIINTEKLNDLIVSIIKREDEKTKELLSEFNDVDIIIQQYGTTLLGISCLFLNEFAVKKILKKNADPTLGTKLPINILKEYLKNNEFVSEKQKINNLIQLILIKEEQEAAKQKEAQEAAQKAAERQKEEQEAAERLKAAKQKAAQKEAAQKEKEAAQKEKEAAERLKAAAQKAAQEAAKQKEKKQEEEEEEKQEEEKLKTEKDQAKQAEQKAAKDQARKAKNMLIDNELDSTIKTLGTIIVGKQTNKLKYELKYDTEKMAFSTDGFEKQSSSIKNQNIPHLQEQEITKIINAVEDFITKKPNK
jgi:ankyrin repeat protein